MSDSIPLEQFPLKWRFTDPKYNVLPKEVLERFHPLNSQEAAEIADAASTVVKNYDIDPAKYSLVQSIDTGEETNTVREWLKERLQLQSLPVTVSWDAKIGMRVKLEDFCDYWDDFCYPGSDDVVILPDSREWVLYFFHEEKFLLGQRAL